MPSSSNIKTNLFADDTMFFCTNMAKKQAAKQIQLQLNKTTKWLEEWRITLNPKKSIAVLFGDRLLINMEELNINSQKIKWSKPVKYLGVRIDDKLKFTQHTREITT